MFERISVIKKIKRSKIHDKTKHELQPDRISIHSAEKRENWLNNQENKKKKHLD